MKSLNNHELIGFVGSDPDIKDSKQSLVVTFSVATTDSWKDKNTNERKEHAEWHKVVAFGKVAEIVRDYVEKGSHVFVSGSVRTNKWEDSEKNQRSEREIVLDDLILLKSKDK